MSDYNPTTITISGAALRQTGGDRIDYAPCKWCGALLSWTNGKLDAGQPIACEVNGEHGFNVITLKAGA